MHSHGASRTSIYAHRKNAGSRLGLKSLAGLAARALISSSAWAAPIPFVPGDLVVTRSVGGAVDTSGGAGSTGAITTSTALTGSGTAASVFLDEYTPAGVLVQSI